MEHKEKHFSLSWFFKWFLDNKAITVFLVTLLLGLNIYLLSKISFIFLPDCGLDGEAQDQSCSCH